LTITTGCVELGTRALDATLPARSASLRWAANSLSLPNGTMTRQSAFLIRLIACIAAVIQIAPAVSAQQQPQHPPPNPLLGFIPVRLVVPESSTGPAAHVQIMHNASDSSYVILLPGSLATSGSVYAGASAIRNLLYPEAAKNPSSNQVLNVDVAGAVPTRAGAIADRLLARLRASTPYVDGTFGLVRSTIVYVRRPGVWKVVTQGGAPAPPPAGHP